jgi:phage shock protein A
MAETTLPPSEPDTPLLYLRAIRTILEGHTRQFEEVITRMGRVEREVVASRREITNLHEDWVGMAKRLDNLDRRMARIERRLDLVEEPT